MVLMILHSLMVCVPSCCASSSAHGIRAIIALRHAGANKSRSERGDESNGYPSTPGNPDERVRASLVTLRPSWPTEHDVAHLMS